MAEVSLKDLLQAGVHFGHQTHRWNPKMRKYIFAERGGIYLIDLKKTLFELERAHELVRQTILDGKNVMFVCTKQQLAPVVRSEAERCGAFYVTERWLGGMLTNFQTIKQNIRRLKELERGAEEGAFEFYTKKERLLLERERLKLDRYLSGIKDMTRVPGLVFVVDAKKEEIAIREANRLGIPVVAIADTNADPDQLTIAIAGNDDAIRSVSLITGTIADAVEMARREAPEATVVDQEEAYTYSSDAPDAKKEDSGDSQRRKKRRSRPRRRPRPEVIAKKLQPEGEGADAEGATAEGEAKESAAPAEAEPVAETSQAEDPVAEAPAEKKAAEPPQAEEPDADGALSSAD
jgi:small subunit ribosomal protein S2